MEKTSQLSAELLDSAHNLLLSHLCESEEEEKGWATGDLGDKLFLFPQESCAQI